MTIFEKYLACTRQSEPPTVYHRWSAISVVAAALGRTCWLPFGHFRIFPNLYVMLIGEVGARKSTAIKMSRSMLSAVGYETFAADKTTKEKFLLDLEGHITDDMSELTDKQQKQRIYDAVMRENLWGEEGFTAEAREVYISADEFNEFAGAGNLEFYSTLGNLWDWDNETIPFKQRLKNSRSVSIYQPTINILGGNTPDNFARCFPAEIMGQGFLSRMLIIHGEPSGRKFTFPPPPDKELTDAVTTNLRDIRSGKIKGEIAISTSARTIFDKIYNSWTDLADVRFKSYSSRRFTQLLKLSIIHAAGMGSPEITDEIAIISNTVLSAAENNMATAIGQFGKGKHSQVADDVMKLLGKARKPMEIQQIWSQTYKDLEKVQQLGEILQALQNAGKIQYIKAQGYLPKKSVGRQNEFVDWKLLTEEERLGL